MKIALVTGASSGLGREFVRQIAEQGKVEEIWVSARRRDRLEALQSISAVPIRVLALDLTRPGDMEYLRNTLQDELPPRDGRSPSLRSLLQTLRTPRPAPVLHRAARHPPRQTAIPCSFLVPSWVHLLTGCRPISFSHHRLPLWRSSKGLTLAEIASRARKIRERTVPIGQFMAAAISS